MKYVGVLCGIGRDGRLTTHFYNTLQIFKARHCSRANLCIQSEMIWTANVKIWVQAFESRCKATFTTLHAARRAYLFTWQSEVDSKRQAQKQG